LPEEVFTDIPKPLVHRAWAAMQSAIADGLRAETYRT
jgi:hypothetical protein